MTAAPRETTLHFLIASFNRREKTLAAIANLAEQSLPPGFAIDITLVDASSPDETAAAVRESFPDVDLIDVPSDQFWADCMRIGEQRIFNRLDPTFDRDGALVWLNDDVELYAGSLDKVCRWLQHRPVEAVFVGTFEGHSGERTYGLRSFRRGLGLTYNITIDSAEARTFNGNLVVIPLQIARRFPIPAEYHHAMADSHLGFQMTRSGVRLETFSEPVGYCDRNPPLPTVVGPIKALRAMQNPKDLPWREWTYFVRNSAGSGWPWWSVSPYLKRSVKGTVAWLRRSAGR